MKILFAYAHTLQGKGTGANGFINEGKESRDLTDLVVDILKKQGHTVKVIGFIKSNNYLTELAKIANKEKFDLVIQIHFNANKTTLQPMGTEIFHYYTNSKMKEVATRINNNLGTIFKNRGVKTNKQMNGRDAWLRLNKNPALLIETCFVDSKKDTDIYNSNKHKIANLIATGITNTNLQENNNLTNSKKLYRVSVGSYNKDNAIKMKNELISKGYKDTFIMEV